MDDITKRITDFNKGRLPEMLEIKYKIMKENLFRFYRGTCHLFYEDLSKETSFPSSPSGWICGDLHLENFGSFRSDNNQVYFDLNDFDEAILAPVAWEAVRLVTSIFIAFETLGIEEIRATKMAQLYLKTYSAILKKGKANYIEPNTAQGIVRDFLSRVSKRKQKAILQKRTTGKKDKLEIFMDDPRHLKLETKFRKALCKHVKAWLGDDEHSPYNYKIADACFRLAGTGSVGLRRYEFLLKSSNKAGEKYFLLDMKQASPSSLAPYISIAQPGWSSEADRIRSVQQRMQNRSPALLSTSEFLGESYIMQEMQPSKDSINFKQIKDQYRDMYRVIDDMAMLTASTQLRSSGQDGSAITDELKKFGEDESWHEAVMHYAVSYKHKAKKDYADFLISHKNGHYKNETTN